MYTRNRIIGICILCVCCVIMYLWDKYKDDDNDHPTPPGFRWGD